MPWLQLRIDTSAELAEQVGGMMSANGAQAVTFVDAKDTPMYEPKPGEVMLWPDTQVVGLFDAADDMPAIIKRLEKARVLGKDFKYRLEPLEDKDWEREWMDNFHPMKFGERLWICPSWRDVPEPDAVNVMLDPGLAFGTGTHPTTALCLRWLDGIEVAGKTVVDFGCGSGILAIAALKLGAKEVIGIDIDPQALQASKSSKTICCYLTSPQKLSNRLPKITASTLLLCNRSETLNVCRLSKWRKTSSVLSVNLMSWQNWKPPHS